MRYGAYCAECRKLGNLNCEGCELNITWELDTAAADALTLFADVQAQVKTVGKQILGLDYGALFQVADVYCMEVTPAIWRYIKAIEEEVFNNGKH